MSASTEKAQGSTRSAGRPPGEAEAAGVGSSKARAILSITVARALSVVLGLGREILASAYYGTSPQFSAFAIAFQVPTAAQVLVGQGALSAALLPALVQFEEEEDTASLVAIVSRLLLLVTGVLTAVSVVFVLLAPTLLTLFLGSGFSASTQGLTVALSQMLFPVVILLGAQSISVAVLNSRSRFTLAAYAPAVWNVAVVAVLVVLHPAFSADHSIYAYAIAVLAGSAAQLIWLLPGLTIVRWKAAWSKTVDRTVLRTVLIRVAPVAFVAAAWQGDFIINLIVGSFVGEAAPRAIQAAQRLSTVGYGLVSVAISTVAFPTFRRQILRGDHTALGGFVERSMRVNLILLLPVAALVIVLATPFTSVMYERGEFGSHSTELVASALVWIIVGLPAGGIWDLLTKVCFATDRYWPPAMIAFVGLVLDLILSLALERVFGIRGIALASSASFTAATVILAIFVQMKIVGYGLAAVLWSAVRLSAAASLAAAAAWLTIDAIHPTATGGFSRNLVTLLATAALGCGLYALGVRILASADASLVTAQLRRAMPSSRQERPL